jgi:membrane-associated phospholipid phosphatase
MNGSDCMKTLGLEMNRLASLAEAWNWRSVGHFPARRPNRRQMAFPQPAAIIPLQFPRTCDQSMYDGPSGSQVRSSRLKSLPLAALACAARQGRAGETVLGFAAQAAVVNGSKAALRDAQINQRPDGTGRGFPSGHSAAAMFGAANLAEFCYQGRPALQFASYSLALAVGLSRVEANRHTPFQVAAGLAVGYFANGLRLAPSKHGMSLRVRTC